VGADVGGAPPDPTSFAHGLDSGNDAAPVAPQRRPPERGCLLDARPDRADRARSASPAHRLKRAQT
jgi:hypothetical protein